MQWEGDTAQLEHGCTCLSRVGHLCGAIGILEDTDYCSLRWRRLPLHDSARVREHLLPEGQANCLHRFLDDSAERVDSGTVSFHAEVCDPLRGLIRPSRHASIQQRPSRLRLPLRLGRPQQARVHNWLRLAHDHAIVRPCQRARNIGSLAERAGRRSDGQRRTGESFQMNERIRHK